MGVLSKLAYRIGQPILHSNCYETIHPWNPNCYGAIWDAVPDGVRFSLKTYISFYLLTNFVSKRGRLDKVNWQKFFFDVLHSATFLVVNMILWLMFLCRTRHLLGFFTPYSMGLVSSMFASGIAIFFEKKSRRPALALYLTNLASETFYNHLALHGKAPLFKYGECIPFGIGLMIFSFLQTSGRLPKSFNGFINAALKSNVTGNIIDAKKLPDTFNAFLTHLRTEYAKTELCHHGNSCVSHAVEGFTKNFAVGFVASSALTLVRNYRLIFRNPSRLLVLLVSKTNFKMPMFAGLLPFIFNVSRCSMNRIGHSPPMMNNVISAGLSSMSMVFFPNISIAMYCLWKAIETLYFDLVDRGWLPKLKYGEIILYAISTGYVLWNVIVEPSTMRRGYLNFLGGLVNGKFSEFNRRLYDHFGYVSREIYDGSPVLNPKYVTINPMLYQPLVT